MLAYAYQGSLYCETCGQEVIEEIRSRRDAAERFGSLDSNVFPQAACNGGGEADSPSHCDSCGRFLANPLTADGLQYVREKLEEYGPRLDVWGPFYLPEEWSELTG